MKKLISFIMLILVLGLASCEAPLPTDYYTQEEVDLLVEQEIEKAIEEYDVSLQLELDVIKIQIQDILDLPYYTEEEVDNLIGLLNNALVVLENDIFANAELIDEIEEILISIEVIDGLNGQKVYYIPNGTKIQFLSSVNESKIDTEKAPSYILDSNGNYLDYETAIHILCTKYYSSFSLNRTFILGRVGYDVDTDLIIEDFVARTILLIEELQNYDFWLIGASYLYIQTNSYGTNSVIQIYMPSLRSSFIEWDASLFINEEYEVSFINLVFDRNQTQILYQQYVDEKIFEGFKLDYK